MELPRSVELRKFVAPEFVLGAGARRLAGQYARNFGARKVLVVTDSGVTAAGWAGEVIDTLEAAGLACSVYAGVTPNPRDHEVMAGTEQYRQEGCNVLVAVGGGSVIDCAKGIGIVSSNGREILDFEGIDRVEVPMPPLVCVPTTSGTGADLSQFAIINDTGRRVKIAIISKAVVPDVSLIDPETLLTMSPFLTACTGLDTLAHAFEAYVSNARSPITDLNALDAVRRVATYLPRVMAHPDDLALRQQVMLASLEAGLAFSNASLGAVHALAHSLGGFRDLAHGQCNAILLRHVVAFNFPEAEARYLCLGEALGLSLQGRPAEEQKRLVLDALDELRRQVGVGQTLGMMGVSRSDIPALARKALRDACMVTNPRRPSQRDVERIYEEAL